MSSIVQLESNYTQTQQEQEKETLAQKQLIAKDQLSLQQEGQDIMQLYKNLNNQYASAKAQEQVQEQAATNEEQGQYIQAFSSINQAEQQIANSQAQAATGASSIIASAAARGINIGRGAVQGATVAGQQNSLVATAGKNGKAAVAGEAGIDTTKIRTGNPNSKNLTDSNPISSVKEALTNTAVKDAVAANAMSLTEKQGKANIYSSATSPLTALSAYEKNANMAIGQQEKQLAISGTGNLRSIAQGAATFESGEQQQLYKLQLQQQQQLGQEGLGLVQDVAKTQMGEAFQAQTDTQENAFTMQNMQLADDSAWINMISQGLSIAAML